VDGVGVHLFANAAFAQQKYRGVRRSRAHRGGLGRGRFWRNSDNIFGCVVGFGTLPRPCLIVLEPAFEALHLVSQISDLVQVGKDDFSEDADHLAIAENGNPAHNVTARSFNLEFAFFREPGPGHDIHARVLNDRSDMTPNGVGGLHPVDLLEALIDIRDEAVAVDEHQAVGRGVKDAFKQVQPRPHFQSVSGFQLLVRVRHG
jgi:hypothetical protein